jgi:hypothetical protein
MAKISEIQFTDLYDSVVAESLAFARNTVAYQPCNGSQVLANVQRIEPVTVVSPVVVSTVSDVWVCGTDGEFLYAINDTDLYISSNGIDFTLYNAFASAIRSMHVTIDRTLLVGLADGKMYRFADDTWTLVTTAEVGAFVNWSWSEIAGHIFVTEYRSSFDADNARRVSLSKDDGKTWAEIYEPANVAGAPGQHAHTPCGAIVNGKVVCYVSYGDGDNAMIRKLTYNGATWDVEQLDTYIPDQPTSALYVPESNIIIWGSDGTPRSSAICIHHLDTDLMDIVQYGGIQDFSATMADKYINFFGREKVGDLYAFVFTGERNGVFVSRDGLNWVSLYVGTFAGGSYAKAFNGKLFWADNVSAITYYCDMPTVQTTYGLLLERESNNCFGDPTYTFTDTEGYIDLDDDITASDMPIEERANVAARISTNTDVVADKYIKNGAVLTVSAYAKANLGIGDWAYTSMYTKGRFTANRETDFPGVYAEIYDNGVGGTNEINTRLFLSDGRWRRTISAVESTYAHAASRGKAWLRILADAGAPTGFDFYLADWLFEASELCPASYQPRDPARLQETLSQTIAYGATFSDVITFAPTFDSTFCFGKALGDYVFIKTWLEDADNYMALVLDTFDKKLKIIDQTGAILLSGALEFYENQPITVLITRNGTSVSLYIWTSAGYVAVGSDDIAALTFASVKWGCNAAGVAGGSFIFIRNNVYNTVIAANDISGTMQWPVVQENCRWFGFRLGLRWLVVINRKEIKDGFNKFSFIKEKL